MKILYIAFECNPYRGSECAIGWSWPFFMRKYHEVYVLTRKEHKSDIEKYMKEQEINDITFFYFDIPDKINFYKKTGRFWLIYYRLWQSFVQGCLRKINKENSFDIIHHVTMNEFRTIEQTWRLNSKFIFGPSGGGQVTPSSLVSYTKGHREEEKIREWINWVIKHSRRYQRSINHADMIFMANSETRDFILPIIKEKEKCHMMIDVGIPEQEIMNRYLNEESTVMTFIWAGRMVYRKGLDIFVDALRMLDKSLKYRVILCGDGPEKTYLESKVIQYDLRENVLFVGNIAYDRMTNYYQQSNVFVFPSLRETSGTVLLEAMSYGLPIIGFRNGGLGEMVTEKEGFFIKGSNKEAVLNNFKMILEECIKDPKKVKEKGILAKEKVLNEYTWEKKVHQMKEYYKRVV